MQNDNPAGFDGQTRCNRCGTTYRGMTCDLCERINKSKDTVEDGTPPTQKTDKIFPRIQYLGEELGIKVATEKEPVPEEELEDIKDWAIRVLDGRNVRYLAEHYAPPVARTVLYLVSTIEEAGALLLRQEQLIEKVGAERDELRRVLAMWLKVNETAGEGCHETDAHTRALLAEEPPSSEECTGIIHVKETKNSLEISCTECGILPRKLDGEVQDDAT